MGGIRCQRRSRVKMERDGETDGPCAAWEGWKGERHTHQRRKLIAHIPPSWRPLHPQSPAPTLWLRSTRWPRWPRWPRGLQRR